MFLQHLDPAETRLRPRAGLDSVANSAVTQTSPVQVADLLDYFCSIACLLSLAKAVNPASLPGIGLKYGLN